MKHLIFLPDRKWFQFSAIGIGVCQQLTECVERQRICFGVYPKYKKKIHQDQSGWKYDILKRVLDRMIRQSSLFRAYGKFVPGYLNCKCIKSN